MKRILIDTDAYAAFKHGDPQALAALRRAPGIGLCPTVLGELLAGFACGSKVARNRRELDEFVRTSRVRQLAIDAETAEHYAAIFAGLRRKGRPVPGPGLAYALRSLADGREYVQTA